MQPYIFPYIGYFQLISAVDKFIIYDDVNFIKKGWINRNNILVNGEASLITIPLKEVSQNKLIKEISISEDNNWRQKILKTIEISYKKAPFFNDVFHLLKNCIESQSGSIAGFNLFFLKDICDYLKIVTEFVDTSSVYDNRNLKGEARILDICLKEKSRDYINPIGGVELYSKDKFLENNINLHFIKPLPLKYKQFDKEFVPWLSIIDVMMFNSVEDTGRMLKQYELI